MPQLVSESVESTLGDMPEMSQLSSTAAQPEKSVPHRGLSSSFQLTNDGISGNSALRLRLPARKIRDVQRLDAEKVSLNC